MPLYVVATPIGNWDDLSVRAARCLAGADLVVCEEAKPAKALLKHLQLFKELVCLNEHSEPTGLAQELVPLVQEGKSLVLISDCGTPLFADPGHSLVKACLDAGLPVIPLPGPSSLMTALSVSGLQFHEFYYAGFLPRKAEERKKALSRLAQFACPVALLEAPYRLQALLEDVKESLPQRRLVLALALTQPDEAILRGTAGQLLKQLGTEKVKSEFVLILQPK